MRYGIPRSPSPARDRPRASSSFGLVTYADSSDEEDLTALSSDSEVDSGLSDESAESTPFVWRKTGHVKPQSRAPLRRPPNPTRSAVSPKKVSATEHRQLEEALASIRLRSQHHDPYDEWERNIRKESFKNARKTYAETQSKLHESHLAQQARDLELRNAQYAAQRREAEMLIQQMRAAYEKERVQLLERLKLRDQTLWRNVDAAIALDTQKVEARLAVERKIQEEADKKRKDEEIQRRLEDEKRRAAEDKQRLEREEKQREEEERKNKEAQKKQEEEDEAKQAQEEAAKVEAEKKARMEKMASEKGVRSELGMSIAQDDWWEARKFMDSLKKEVMPVVKNKSGNSAEARTTWSNLRRQITPKIGQLTDDPAQISRVSDQIVQILQPSGGHNPIVYYGLLSSLAKAITQQAEAEVSTAPDQRSAYPIAQVAFNLLERLDGFHEVLWARIVTRTGGWAIPMLLGNSDWDGRKWQSVLERKKAMGYQQSEATDGSMVWETEEQYNMRMAGIMRVYFSILAIRPPRQPLKGSMWQTPMYWRWIARLLGSDGGGRAMLEKSVAADVLAAALQAFGTEAKSIWGQQFVKVLALIHEGVTSGFGDSSGSKIGGPTPDGSAARMRVLLEIERIMSS